MSYHSVLKMLRHALALLASARTNGTHVGASCYCPRAGTPLRLDHVWRRLQALI